MLEKSIEEKIEQLGYTIPKASKPLFEYVPIVIHNRFAFVSGQLPRMNGELIYKGKLGQEVSIEEGQKASIICVLNALSHLKQELGSLEEISRIIKVNGFVNSAPGFTDQPSVINGASKFLTQVFGEKGRHARTAIGASELPSHAPVEIEMIVALP
jgi:enamine deaminase RidA (YjgF/YER057c/UK114 family)